MKTRSIAAGLLAAALAACSSSPSASPTSPPSSAHPTSGAASTPAPLPSPTWSPAEATAALDAFRIAVRDPAYRGTGLMESTVTREGPPTPEGALTGMLAWDGGDVSQSILVERVGRSAPIPKAEARVRGDTAFIRVCGYLTCFEAETAWWTKVEETDVEGLTLIQVLRGNLDLDYGGRVSVDGVVLDRLTGTVDDLRPFGWVTTFGRASAPEGSTADLEILTDRDGRPAHVRAHVAVTAFGNATTIDLDWTLAADLPNGLELPEPHQTLAYLDSPAGYRVAVPMSWIFIPGKPGGIDSFVAPKDARRQELRIRLGLEEQASIDTTFFDRWLGQRLADEYGGQYKGSHGGFMGAVNGIAVSVDANIDGRPTSILAGILYWQGSCPGTGLDCQTKYSIIELRSDPGGNPDVDFDFFNMLAQSVLWRPLQG